jgi:AcrR family transcriptional regulator
MYYISLQRQGLAKVRLGEFAGFMGSVNASVIDYSVRRDALRRVSRKRRQGINLLRKLPKDQRKDKILDSVEALILATSSTDFTMVQLAKHVGISPTTFYNLFGSKGNVIYSLLNRALDAIITGRDAAVTSSDPVEQAIGTMTYAAEHFVQNRDLYRPIYQFQISDHDMGGRQFYLQHALVFWKRCLGGLVAAGYLFDDPSDGGFACEDVALALLTHSSGVIDLWIQDDLDDDAFIARMTHDAALMVYAVVPDAQRAQIAARLKKGRPLLRNFSFLREE